MATRKRHISETEDLDQDSAEGASLAEARDAGVRCYKHWRDRGEPAVTMSSIAMRQACPYRDPPQVEAFFLGWRSLDGSLWDYEWCGSKFPARKGARCRVLARARNLVEVEFADGERVGAPAWWIRRRAS